MSEYPHNCTAPPCPHQPVTRAEARLGLFNCPRCERVCFTGFSHCPDCQLPLH